MKIHFISAAIFVFAALKVFAGTLELDGKYIYVAIGENYQQTQASVALENGKATFVQAGQEPRTILAEISNGPQTDLVEALAALGKSLPESLLAYNAMLDIRNDGTPVPVTIVKEMRDTQTLLTFYVVVDGLPKPIIARAIKGQ